MCYAQWGFKAAGIKLLEDIKAVISLQMNSDFPE